MKKSTIKIYYLILLVLTVCSCSIFGHEESRAIIRFQAVKYLNPDVNGNASPIVVTLYQLKNPFAFQQASYAELTNNSGKILGANLVDKSVTELRPGAQLEINEILPDSTRYIGIIASYRNIDNATWRALVKVENATDKTTVINVDLESQIMLAKASYQTGLRRFL